MATKRSCRGSCGPQLHSRPGARVSSATPGRPLWTILVRLGRAPDGRSLRPGRAGAPRWARRPSGGRSVHRAAADQCLASRLVRRSERTDDGGVSSREQNGSTDRIVALRRGGPRLNRQGFSGPLALTSRSVKRHGVSRPPSRHQHGDACTSRKEALTLGPGTLGSRLPPRWYLRACGDRSLWTSFTDASLESIFAPNNHIRLLPVGP